MQITTYYVIGKRGQIDADTRAVLHRINDIALGNGDNRSWNTLRTQLDALLDEEVQRRYGIAIEAEECELFED